MSDDEDQPFRLDEDTWGRIKTLSGPTDTRFTDTTRSEIEFLIDWLGPSRRKKSNIAKTLKSLKITLDQLSATRAALQSLSQDNGALETIAIAENPADFIQGPRKLARMFQDTANSVEDRAKELQKALERFAVRRGPEGDQPITLVSLLDDILYDASGRRIRRTSGKNDLDWIEIICQHFEPSWGRGQIQAAMKVIERDNRQKSKRKRKS